MPPTPPELLLPRLEGVRRAGRGWIARCPAHEDRSPSLSIGAGDDGRVLVHCFGGCPVSDVLAAVGLSVNDLFERRLPDRHMTPAERRALRERARVTDVCAAVRILDREAALLLIAAGYVDRGDPLTADDHDRLAIACQRISLAREALRA